MNKTRLGHVRLLVATLALAVPATAAAQTAPAEPATFTTWFRDAIQSAVLLSKNATGTANQTESPSTDATSTSLVDTSSSSDFVSTALNLSGLRKAAGDDSAPTSGSVTATLYSLVAAAKGKALTDPQYYKTGTKWRQVSFTLGSEESTLADHFTDKPSTNVGFKILILNSRDIYSAHAQAQLQKMDLGLATLVDAKGRLFGEMLCAVFRAAESVAAPPDVACTPGNAAFVAFQATALGPAGWPAVLEKMQANDAGMKEVDDIVSRSAALHMATSSRIADAVEQIQRGRQLSVAYFTKQREDDGTDEHRAELIFDYGLSDRLGWTVNASFDYSDRHEGDDAHSGRVATEFQAKVGNVDRRAWNARPVTLSGGGEFKKSADEDALIRAQLKLVVPILAGLDLPIAYSYANRDTETVTAGSQLKVSLAIDPVRLRERFR